MSKGGRCRGKGSQTHSELEVVNDRRLPLASFLEFLDELNDLWRVVAVEIFRVARLCPVFRGFGSHWNLNLKEQGVNQNRARTQPDTDAHLVDLFGSNITERETFASRKKNGKRNVSLSWTWATTTQRGTYLSSAL